MKKTIFATLGLGLASLTVLAVAAPSVLAETAGTVTGTAGATTKTELTIKSGNLSATVNGDVTFPAASLGEAWTSGYDKPGDKDIDVDVQNFLGTDDTDWNLQVTAGGWQAADGGSKSGAAILNDKAELKLTTDKAKAEKLTAGAPVSAYEGQVGEYSSTSGEGEYNLTAAKLNLKFDNHLNLKAGAYTNTLTWTLAATPASVAE
jgi:hypothetical protein